jgi:hypothetical protein
MMELIIKYLWQIKKLLNLADYTMAKSDLHHINIAFHKM